MKPPYYALISICCFAAQTVISCRKLVQIPPPINSISTSQVFATDQQATSAMNGLYFNMINAAYDPGFSRGGITIYAGLSSDEFDIFNTTNTDAYQFQQNTLSPDNTVIGTNLWQTGYSYNYEANAIIEGLANGQGVHDSVKNELIAEAKFVRAFQNFYLINLFGDIPLVSTINWRKTDLLSRTKVSEIYASIISDLKDAQVGLASDYSVGNGERIIPNKFAATAFLARVYLYLEEWQNAEDQSTQVINNSTFYQLVDSLNDAFKTNSTEAIWQLKQDNTNFSLNATFEGFTLIPSAGSPPFVYITPGLLNEFENGDRRKIAWLDSTNYDGTIYYYPHKYKTGPDQIAANGPYNEYYMVLRLAEQYLIRAEARAHLGKLVPAINDLDLIRHRAGLLNTTAALQPDILTAILKERRIELLAEWGHRWLDLKRFGNADSVLSPIKLSWTANAKLYPIPQYEIQTDPNLSQNPGY